MNQTLPSSKSSYSNSSAPAPVSSYSAGSSKRGDWVVVVVERSADPREGAAGLEGALGAADWLPHSSKSKAAGCCCACGTDVTSRKNCSLLDGRAVVTIAGLQLRNRMLKETVQLVATGWLAGVTDVGACLHCVQVGSDVYLCWPVCLNVCWSCCCGLLWRCGWLHGSSSSNSSSSAASSSTELAACCAGRLATNCPLPGCGLAAGAGWRSGRNVDWCRCGTGAEFRSGWPSNSCSGTCCWRRGGGGDWRWNWRGSSNCLDPTGDSNGSAPRTGTGPWFMCSNTAL